jgi:uncharacterized membrane protein YgcG
VAWDVGARILPSGEWGHVVVVLYHTYYNRKFRAAIVRTRKKPLCVDAWSSSSWMRLGTGGPGGGGEIGGGGGEGGIVAAAAAASVLNATIVLYCIVLY